jgi:hypothetical protein
MLFGVNPAADALLAMLLVDTRDVPRFRDCYLKGDTIVIYTRTGGGNREAYEAQNARLRALPGFIEDADFDFDSTFACFSYAIPPQYADLCEQLRSQGAERNPSVEWPRLLAKLQDPAMKDDPEVRAVIDKMRPVMDKLESAFKGSGPSIIEV